MSIFSNKHFLQLDKAIYDALGGPDATTPEFRILRDLIQEQARDNLFHFHEKESLDHEEVMEEQHRLAVEGDLKKRRDNEKQGKLFDTGDDDDDDEIKEEAPEQSKWDPSDESEDPLVNARFHKEDIHHNVNHAHATINLEPRGERTAIYDAFENYCTRLRDKEMIPTRAPIPARVLNKLLDTLTRIYDEAHAVYIRRWDDNDMAHTDAREFMKHALDTDNISMAGKKESMRDLLEREFGAARLEHELKTNFKASTYQGYAFLHNMLSFQPQRGRTTP